jgi:hypothetical protein
MSTPENLHKNIPDAERHNPKGFESASNGSYGRKDLGGNLVYDIEYWTQPVTNLVDMSLAPPSELNGTRYIIVNLTGTTIHADWDGAVENSIVEYFVDTSTWGYTAPVIYQSLMVANSSEQYYFDGTQWQGKGTGTVGGTGTAGYVPVWSTGGTNLEDSKIQSDNNTVGIGIAPDANALLYLDSSVGNEVLKVSGDGVSNAIEANNVNVSNSYTIESTSTGQGGGAFKGTSTAVTTGSSNLDGIYVLAQNDGTSGSPTGNIRAVNANIQAVNGSRTIPNIFGFHLQNMTTHSSVTVDNLYQMYLGTHGSATKGSGNFYGVFQNDSALRNVFKGKTDIGTATTTDAYLTLGGISGADGINMNVTGNAGMGVTLTNTVDSSVYGVTNNLVTVNGASNHKIHSFKSKITATLGAEDTYGFYSEGHDSAASTITDAYHVYLDSHVGSITNTYGIKQVGTGDKNEFAGTTAFGTTATTDKQVNVYRSGDTGDGWGVYSRVKTSGLSSNNSWARGVLGRADGSNTTGMWVGLQGVYGFPTETGTVAEGIAVMGQVNTYSIGSDLYNVYGFFLEQINVNSGDTVNSVYGLYLQGSGGSGTVSNDRYGIYQQGASDLNYFAGNVGIGTTTLDSSVKLQVQDSGNTYLKIESTNNEAGFYLNSDSAGTNHSWKIYGSSANLWIRDEDAGADRVKITSGGDFQINERLGIGTAPASGAVITTEASSGTLANLRLTGGTTNVSSPIDGDLWYNTTTGELNFYDGSSTTDLLAVGGNLGETTVKIIPSNADVNLYSDSNLDLFWDVSGTDIELDVKTDPATSRVHAVAIKDGTTSAFDVLVSSGNVTLEGAMGTDDKVVISINAPSDSAYPSYRFEITRSNSFYHTNSPFLVIATKWTSYD